MGHDHRRSHFSGSLPFPASGSMGTWWWSMVSSSQTLTMAIGSLADVKSRLHMPLTHTIPYHHPTWMNFGGYSTRRWLYIHRRHKRIWICNGLSENRERRNPLVYHHFPFWKQPFGVYIDHFRTEPYVAMFAVDVEGTIWSYGRSISLLNNHVDPLKIWNRVWTWCILPRHFTWLWANVLSQYGNVSTMAGDHQWIQCFQDTSVTFA